MSLMGQAQAIASRWPLCGALQFLFFMNVVSWQTCQAAPQLLSGLASQNPPETWPNFSQAEASSVSVAVLDAYNFIRPAIYHYRRTARSGCLRNCATKTPTNAKSTTAPIRTAITYSA